MNGNVIVSPQIGFYLVTAVDRRLGVQTRAVNKRKQCSCGGTAAHPCRHIEEVADYLRRGGEQAPETAEDRTGLRLCEDRDDGPVSGTPMTCPICHTPVEKHDLDFWRCPKDSAHYWQWRGERNGGAIKKFLTQRSHPAKRGAFYAMSLEERESFLEQAARRFNAGGYTAHN